MSITHPRTDVMAALKASAASFVLEFRDELARDAAGRTYPRELGPPLWRGDIVSADLDNDDAAEVEAIVESLGGSKRPFYVYDPRRPYPRAHAAGNFNDTGTISAMQGGNELRLANLDAGFTLSVGDFLAFDYGAAPSRALHRVLETVTADGSGLTPFFEVAPHIRTGASVGSSVTLKQPSMLATIVPGQYTPRPDPPMFMSYSITVVQYV